ncbi:cytochrome c maturation protein CcmE [Phaeovibrio sulfidiphilus]|uniref:Cytochrome c-type biogenesis protein CcmE n=1 Tax=Phaeovibrio sulfidiphilus TaxID=1220600 RepID=A0A8J6YX86_9PROT|nr:cytochrome c maturation protein CcmE [Phaeovibrio sulfidiphilus]
MNRRKRRLYFIALGVITLLLAGVLLRAGMEGNIVFFYSPTDLAEKGIESGKRFRVGGLVEEGSVEREGTSLAFTITDGLNEMRVVYTGLVPDLFREGQGVIAEGRLDEDGKVFRADNVLARHDENYMPPEVADSLKETGQWQHATPDDTGLPKFLKDHETPDEARP